MKNIPYFSPMNAIQSLARQTFVNQKLDFVEELVLYTDAHIFLTGKAGTGKTTFLKNLPLKTYKRMDDARDRSGTHAPRSPDERRYRGEKRP